MAEDELEEVWRAEFLGRICPAFEAACAARSSLLEPFGEYFQQEIKSDYMFAAGARAGGVPVAVLTANYAAGGNVDVLMDPGTPGRKQTYTLTALTPGIIESIVEAWVAAAQASR